MTGANKASEAAVRVARGEIAAEFLEHLHYEEEDTSSIVAKAADKALAAAHDPQNFEDPREVSVNLGVAFDALDEAAQIGTPVGWNIWARKVLLRRFGGDRG